MKHNSKMKRMRAAIVLVSLVILVLPMISAFANTFLPDKTMELYKGETGEYCIYLQNTGDEDLVQIIRVFEGEEYIKNINEIGKEFNVVAGTLSDDLPICMKVKLPRDSEKGEKYEISYGVSGSSSDSGEGIVSFAPIQIRETFYLTERLDERPSSNTKYIVSGLAITAVLAIGYYYRRRRIRKLKM